jgi:hypothetical protein
MTTNISANRFGLIMNKKSVFSVVFALIIIGMFAVAYNIAMSDQSTKLEVENQVTLFAASGMSECFNKGGSTVTKNSCINEVVTAAGNTRGANFAKLVGTRLASEK